MSVASLTIRRLAQQIRQMERAHRCQSSTLSVELAAGPLRQLLGVSTLPRGCLLEWLGDRAGAGLMTVAFESLRAMASSDRPAGLVIIVDSGQDLFPLGMSTSDLQQTVIVRPPRLADALWTMEQALRTPGVEAVVGAIERLPSASFRRLQLAAEAGGALGVLLRSERCAHEPSFAEYRILVRPVPIANDLLMKRQWQLELLRSRGRFHAGRLVVELDHEATVGLRVVSELVTATSCQRAS